MATFCLSGFLFMLVTTKKRHPRLATAQLAPLTFFLSTHFVISGVLLSTDTVLFNTTTTKLVRRSLVGNTFGGSSQNCSLVKESPPHILSPIHRSDHSLRSPSHSVSYTSFQSFVEVLLTFSLLHIVPITCRGPPHILFPTHQSDHSLKSSSHSVSYTSVRSLVEVPLTFCLLHIGPNVR